MSFYLITLVVTFVLRPLHIVHWMNINSFGHFLGKKRENILKKIEVVVPTNILSYLLFKRLWRRPDCLNWQHLGGFYPNMVSEIFFLSQKYFGKNRKKNRCCILDFFSTEVMDKYCTLRNSPFNPTFSQNLMIFHQTIDLNMMFRYSLIINDHQIHEKHQNSSQIHQFQQVGSIFSIHQLMVKTGKTNWRGRLSTVDLLALTSLDQLLLKLKTFFTFLQNELPKWGVQLYWAFPFS